MKDSTTKTCKPKNFIRLKAISVLLPLKSTEDQNQWWRGVLTFSELRWMCCAKCNIGERLEARSGRPLYTTVEASANLLSIRITLGFAYDVDKSMLGHPPLPLLCLSLPGKQSPPFSITLHQQTVKDHRACYRLCCLNTASLKYIIVFVPIPHITQTIPNTQMTSAIWLPCDHIFGAEMAIKNVCLVYSKHTESPIEQHRKWTIIISIDERTSTCKWPFEYDRQLLIS